MGKEVGGQKKINNCQIKMLKNQKWCTNYALIATRNKNKMLLTSGADKNAGLREEAAAAFQNRASWSCAVLHVHMLHISD